MAIARVLVDLGIGSAAFVYEDDINSYAALILYSSIKLLIFFSVLACNFTMTFLLWQTKLIYRRWPSAQVRLLYWYEDN